MMCMHRYMSCTTLATTSSSTSTMVYSVGFPELMPTCTCFESGSRKIPVFYDSLLRMNLAAILLPWQRVNNFRTLGDFLNFFRFFSNLSIFENNIIPPKNRVLHPHLSDIFSNNVEKPSRQSKVGWLNITR